VKKFLGGEWLELFEEQRYSVKFSNFWANSDLCSFI
jgi:hypothetical protein